MPSFAAGLQSSDYNLRQEEQDKENQTSSVASCDVIQFSDGRLVEITSYVVELK